MGERADHGLNFFEELKAKGEGDRADSARAVLQRDWVDAEPEFRSSVAGLVLGR